MAIYIKQPEISTTDEKQAIMQIKSYLYQLAEQLNWAFSVLENVQEENKSKEV